MTIWRCMSEPIVHGEFPTHELTEVVSPGLKIERIETTTTQTRMACPYCRQLGLSGWVEVKK